MKNEELKFLTRQNLADKMGISTKTLSKYIIELKNEILKLDPLFDKHNLISPKVSLFIYYEFWPSDLNNPDND